MNAIWQILISLAVLILAVCVHNLQNAVLLLIREERQRSQEKLRLLQAASQEKKTVAMPETGFSGRTM